MTMLVKWSAVMWDMGVPHFDGAFAAREYGLAAPLAHGPLLAALHRRALTDWLAPTDRIAQHEVRLRSPCVAGSVVRIATTIDAVEPRGAAGATVHVSSSMTDQDATIVSVASARCHLADAENDDA
jgi:acyl dehydratase